MQLLGSACVQSPALLHPGQVTSRTKSKFQLLRALTPLTWDGSNIYLTGFWVVNELIQVKPLGECPELSKLQ